MWVCERMSQSYRSKVKEGTCLFSLRTFFPVIHADFFRTISPHGDKNLVLMR